MANVGDNVGNGVSSNLVGLGVVGSNVGSMVGAWVPNVNNAIYSYTNLQIMSQLIL